MKLKVLLKKCIAGLTAMALTAGLTCFTPAPVFAADQVMTLKTARSLALENSSKYESAEDAIVKIGADRVVKELKITDGTIEVVTEVKVQTTDTSWAGEDVSFF